MTADPVAATLALCAERLGSDGSGVLARLAGPLGAAAREARHADPRARAETIAGVRAAVPPWLRLVHPTWIEADLADLPARARTALASGATDALDVWLARFACAALPPMAPSSRDVGAWLRSIALDQLAFALGAAATTAGEPALALAAARIARPPRHGALGPQRAALVRCRGARLDDEHALQDIAARALAPHLAGAPLARWQLTRRLPRTQGLVVEQVLAAAASTPLDQVPTWAALDAD